MLLNKSQAIKFLKQYVEDSLTELPSSPKVSVPKDDSWGVYIKGQEFGIPNSFCGINFLNDRVFMKLWENPKHSMKRLNFLKKLPNIGGLNIWYESKGEYCEKDLDSFQEWQDLINAKYCGLYFNAYQNKDQVIPLLNRIMKIFFIFCIWNKTGKIENFTIDESFNKSESGRVNKRIILDGLFLSQDKPKDSQCSKIIIVGPYPTSGFVKKVISELNPKIVYVVVDESWKPTELEEIENIKSVQLIRVRTENGVGIVHAKMYYVEYEKDSKYYTRLFLGSINASQNSVINNSEFWLSFRLAAFKKNDRDEIKEYFNDLVSEIATTVKSRKIELRNQKKQIISILSFPQITKADKIKSFYNWIRSGSFFVKYEPDSTFGCLTVKLNKERLPKEKLNELLKGSIFENATLKQELRYSYVGDKDAKPESEKWKKFTVDTRNGLWLSYECLASGKDFPPVIAQKSRIIEELKNYDDKKISDKIKYFVNEVKKLRTNDELKKIICVPDASKLKKKIDNDIALANNMEFKNRYETGYATINISTNNSEYLEAIADDFIESCAIKNTKSRVENRMAQIFRNLFEGLSTKEIHRKLLNNWDEYKDDLVNYYKQEEKD